LEKYQQQNGIDNNSKNISQPGNDNLLIMQGGGSLGAYECRVFKVLAKHKIKFDIISGVSIGAVNGAIIAAGLRKGGGLQDIEQQEMQEDVAKTLENFWLEIADTISPATLP
jgi:NTE family protein